MPQLQARWSGTEQTRAIFTAEYPAAEILPITRRRSLPENDSRPTSQHFARNGKLQGLYRLIAGRCLLSVDSSLIVNFASR